MPKQEKGKSHSMRPVSRRPPSWCKYQPEEVDSFIIKLAKEGHSLSAIGTILRDQYAIPLVKPITGKSISDTLKAANLAPTMPEDLCKPHEKSSKPRRPHGQKQERPPQQTQHANHRSPNPQAHPATTSVKALSLRTGSTCQKSLP